MGKFTDDTAVHAVSDNRFAAEFKKGWRIGQVPNGGYTLAIVARALREALPHRDPLSINAFYLAPTTLGPAEIVIEPLKLSRGTSFASASLWQDGELKVRATAAYTDQSRLDGAHWLGNKPPEVPPFAECEARSANVLEIHESVDTRLVAGQEVFEGGELPGTGEFIAWLQHTDGADLDTIDLLMMADIMPPPPFTLFGPFGWVPTVELTVQVRGVPAPGPLLGRHRSRHLTRGIIETDGDFWDSEGQLVALSRQMMKVRLPKNAAEDPFS